MSIIGLVLITALIALFICAVIAVVIVIIVSTHKPKVTTSDQPFTPPVPYENEQPTTSQQSVGENQTQKLTLGEVIKNHRIRCGMTQEFVAESLDVTRQAVSKWETDSSEPSTSNLLALAKLFGISAAELLDGIE